MTDDEPLNIETMSYPCIDELRRDHNTHFTLNSMLSLSLEPSEDRTIFCLKYRLLVSYSFFNYVKFLYIFVK